MNVPDDDQKNDHCDHDGDDDIDKVEDFFLKRCETGRGFVCQLRNAAKDRIVPSGDHDTETRARDAVRALKADVPSSKKVVVHAIHSSW